MSNILAIVGRPPNVGKSTLFNRLIGKRQAIVEESSGVTRDRHYGKSDWNGISFSVIDTGGYVLGSEDIFEEEIRKQVDLAISESDVIVFVLDTRDGVTEPDKDVAQILRKSEKPVLLVANKVDSTLQIHDINEFMNWDLKIIPISAINGSGHRDLLDEVVSYFKESEEETETDIPPISYCRQA